MYLRGKNKDFFKKKVGTNLRKNIENIFVHNLVQIQPIPIDN